MKIVNKRVKFDYEIREKIEAGLVLTGAEVKSVRAKKVDFHGSYVKSVRGEFYVINLYIGSFQPAGSSFSHNMRDLVGVNNQNRRTRKLLLNKKEILSLETKIKAQKLTAIPLSLYTKGRKIKLEIALAKGKRKYEKKVQLKKRDQERDLIQELNPELVDY